MVEWTEAMQAATPPFRGDGTPLVVKKPIDAKKLFAPIATALAPHRAPTYRPRESLVKLAATGEGSDADEADAVFLLASVGQKGAFKGEITMVPEADAEKVVNQGVDRWVQQGGVLRAFELYKRLGVWTPYPEMMTNLAARLARVRLRAWLAHAPAADYEAALTAARATDIDAHAQWKRGHGYNIGAEILTYLFPDDRTLFDAAVERVRAADWLSSLLLGSVTSAKDMQRVSKLLAGSDWDDHALVLVRSLRDDALPFLVEYSQISRHSLTAALALTAFATPEAAAALALFVETKPAQKILAAYFAKHPRLAPEALQPIIDGKAKRPVRDAAAKLLAAIR